MDIPEGIENVIYLDNAATVFPKPPEVLYGMVDAYQKYGVNPGRSGFDLCMVGGSLIEKTRKRLTEFFGGTVPERLCFNYNASEALNILIQGLTEKGDHVVSTVLEHNSVIRPLNHLAQQGIITHDFVACGDDCRVDPDEIARHFKKNTRLVVVNHGSNVVGAIQPVAEIGKLCRERGITFVVDTAQTAGVVPIDMQAMNIDAIAFTGHKSLLGPGGIGGLYVREGLDVRHTRYGGTGVESAHPLHLDFFPYRLEIGTCNLLGIVGLLLAQDWIDERGMDNIYRHEMEMAAKLQAALLQIEKVTVHGTTSLEHRLPVVSFSVEGQDAMDTGTMLDVDHNIATRTGLHCAPLIHDHMGTSPRGTVRMSVGPMNQPSDIDAAIVAVNEVATNVIKK